VKRALEIALGILTSIGGYLDVGAIATAAQAGALFGFAHLWVIVFGTICVVALLEMSGRLAAVSKHTLRAAMRERLGLNFFGWTTIVGLLVNVLVLASELGGIALALELVTGVGFRWWGAPTALFLWLVLWKGTFGAIERWVGLLGLVTVVFVVGAVKTAPPVSEVLAGFIPSAPGHDAGRYWFIAASILGAIISPYMFYFYSSGAVEGGWDESYLGVNRAVAGIGMGFGSIIAVGVLVVSAMVFQPRGITMDSFEQAPLMLSVPMGRVGLWLFAASLFITCFGAALESALTVGYVLAQGLGWDWGESKRPRQAPRFALAYTTAIAVGVLPVLIGVNPLSLTVFTMALTAATLPLVVVPFLVIMNDEHYLGGHRNGRLGNALVLVVIFLAAVLAIVSIPLEIIGG
jgi:Mn2+/Fe2+ NRAMP family transporter